MPPWDLEAPCPPLVGIRLERWMHKKTLHAEGFSNLRRFAAGKEMRQVVPLLPPMLPSVVGFEDDSQPGKLPAGMGGKHGSCLAALPSFKGLFVGCVRTIRCKCVYIGRTLAWRKSW